MRIYFVSVYIYMVERSQILILPQLSWMMLMFSKISNLMRLGNNIFSHTLLKIIDT